MYVPRHRRYRVFVPTPGSRLGIDPRSAIVAHDPVVVAGDAQLVLCWYEGNRYSASNLHRFVERVNNAAGRADQNYPTIAKQAIPRSQLVDVGTYDLQDGRLDVTDPAALATWLDGEPVDPLLDPYARVRASQGER